MVFKFWYLCELYSKIYKKLIAFIIYPRNHLGVNTLLFELSDIFQWCIPVNPFNSFFIIIVNRSCLMSEIISNIFKILFYKILIFFNLVINFLNFLVWLWYLSKFLLSTLGAINVFLTFLELRLLQSKSFFF